jgi:hypothetical protein
MINNIGIDRRIEKGEMFAPLPYSYNEQYYRRTAMEKLCECGCGEVVKNRFVSGHNQRGAKWTEEQRSDFSKSQMGHYVSEEAKKNISIALTGKVLTKEHKEKISKGNMGRIVTKETREKISEAHSGKTLTDEHRAKLVLSHMKPKEDDYCDAWYDTEYKNDLRGSACVVCGITNMMSVHLSGRRLATHHKNGKKECTPKDIVTMCAGCHTRYHALQKKRINGRWSN